VSYAILRKDNGVPTYYSAKTGRQWGNPGGGWVNDAKDAMQFAREQDAKEFMDCFLNRQDLNVVSV